MALPTPGSAAELAAYERLQARLPDLFRRVFADPLEPRTVVIVPGLTMDQDVLAKVLGGLHYEERQLAMLMLLRLPNTRVVFVSSTPIERTIVDYYLGLVPGITRDEARQRLVLLSASDASLLRAALKLNDGIAGEGNAVFSYAGCTAGDERRWIDAHVPDAAVPDERSL